MLYHLYIEWCSSPKNPSPIYISKICVLFCLSREKTVRLLQLKSDSFQNVDVTEHMEISTTVGILGLHNITQVPTKRRIEFNYLAEIWHSIMYNNLIYFASYTSVKIIKTLKLFQGYMKSRQINHYQIFRGLNVG